MATYNKILSFELISPSLKFVNKVNDVKMFLKSGMETINKI
jgi:hypothetical protein